MPLKGLVYYLVRIISDDKVKASLLYSISEPFVKVLFTRFSVHLEDKVVLFTFVAGIHISTAFSLTKEKF